MPPDLVTQEKKGRTKVLSPAGEQILADFVDRAEVRRDHTVQLRIHDPETVTDGGLQCGKRRNRGFEHTLPGAQIRDA